MGCIFVREAMLQVLPTHSMDFSLMEAHPALKSSFSLKISPSISTYRACLAQEREGSISVAPRGPTSSQGPSTAYESSISGIQETVREEYLYVVHPTSLSLARS